jgi:hypothetical protein
MNGKEKTDYLEKIKDKIADIISPRVNIYNDETELLFIKIKGLLKEATDAEVLFWKVEDEMNALIEMNDDINQLNELLMMVNELDERLV